MNRLPAKESPGPDFEKHFMETATSPAIKLNAFSRFVPRQAQSTYLFKWELFKRVEKIHGSIVELGVFQGGGLFSFANFSTITEPYNYQRKIIGFDTFAGFPDIATEDEKTQTTHPHRRTGGFNVSKDHFSELQESIHQFDQNRYLSERTKIELIKGDVCDSIPEYLDQNPHLLISLLYFDMDLYKPTLFALEALYDRVVKGGIVAFDEINDARWPGETTAFLEFFADKAGTMERLAFEPSASFFQKT